MSLGFELGFLKSCRASFGSFWRRRREASLKGGVGFALLIWKMMFARVKRRRFGS